MHRAEKGGLLEMHCEKKGESEKNNAIAIAITIGYCELAWFARVSVVAACLTLQKSLTIANLFFRLLSPSFLSLSPSSPVPSLRCVPQT